MPDFKRTKRACYAAYFTMASIFGLPPVLLVPLHELYGISYTLLGTLVLVNFFTQLTIDLIFSFFSHNSNSFSGTVFLPFHQHINYTGNPFVCQSIFAKFPAFYAKNPPYFSRFSQIAAFKAILPHPSENSLFRLRSQSDI